MITASAGILTGYAPQSGWRRAAATALAVAVWVSLAAIGTFGFVAFAKDAPRVAYPCLAVLLMLLVAGAIFDLWHWRRMRASEAHLGRLACPKCGAIFGATAAREAFQPSPPTDEIEDDFGLTGVECARCGTACLYAREGRVLTPLWRDRPVEERPPTAAPDGRAPGLRRGEGGEG